MPFSRWMLRHWLTDIVKCTISLLIYWLLYCQKTTQIFLVVLLKLGRKRHLEVLGRYTGWTLQRSIGDECSFNEISFFGQFIQVRLHDLAFLVDGKNVFPGQWSFSHAKVIFNKISIQVLLIIILLVPFGFGRWDLQRIFGEGHEAKLLWSGRLVSVIDYNIGLLPEFILIID